MPNASSSIWTLPNTSRLAPATISPDASSTVAVVSTPPGRNVTSGAISVRSPGSAAPRLTASKVSAETTIADRIGHEHGQRPAGRAQPARTPRRARRSPPRSPTSRGVGCRTRQSPTVITAYASTVTTAPCRGGIARMRSQPAQPVRRLDLAALGLVPRARRARRSGRGAARPRTAGSTRSSPSRPARTRSSARSAARRCARHARRSRRRSGVRRSCVSLTAAPARLSARPSSSTNACSSSAPAHERQLTICISRVVLFRRRPPSSVTVTMSSMRTPKRSGEVDPGLDREAHARLERVRLALDHVRRLVRRQPDAVAGAVDELLAVAGVGDHGRARRGRSPGTRRPAAPPRSRPAARGGRSRAPRAPRRSARRRGPCATCRSRSRP